MEKDIILVTILNAALLIGVLYFYAELTELDTNQEINKYITQCNEFYQAQFKLACLEPRPGYITYRAENFSPNVSFYFEETSANSSSDSS